MRSHIIVSGDDALATTIVEELNNAGAHIVKLTARRRPRQSPESPARRAVICAGDDDATNLEIALLARKANPRAGGGPARQ